MGLEDINYKEEYELDNQIENDLEKNNVNINNSGDGITIIAKEENRKYSKSNCENNPQVDAIHIAKKLKIDNEIQEIKYNDQDFKDKEENVSNEDSEGSFSDYTSTEIEDDDTSDDCDSNLDASTDSELYAKNIEEENIDDEDDENLEETDEDCTSLSEQSSIKTDDDFVYEDIISPVEENNDKNNQNKEEETKSDIKDIPLNQEDYENEIMKIFQDLDKLSTKSDQEFKIGDETEVNYDTTDENDYSSDDTETESEVSSDEGFTITVEMSKGIRIESVIYDVAENTIELEFERTNVQNTPANKYDTSDDQKSQNKNMKPSNIDLVKNDYKIEKEDDKLKYKVEEKNDSSSNIENNTMKTDAEPNPVDEELELYILNKFFQSDDELDNIVQETLQNQKYEYEV